MRLIDADALLREMHNVILEDGEDRRTFYEVIQRQPVIDAVPFVRCKDCKHFTPGRSTGYWGTCELTQIPGPEYSSCFDGERRDEDNENNETN